MYFRMLKKDIMRKKTTNIILLIFVILATVFVSSSMKNILVALDGTNYFFEESGLKDYFIITGSDDVKNDEKIENFMKSQEYIKDYTKDEVGFITKNNIYLEDNKKNKLNSMMILSSVDIEQQKFFNEEDEIIEDVKEGHIYIPRSFAEESSIKTGDVLTITDNKDKTKEFIVDGIFKDALLGSAMMGTHRCIINQKDFEYLMDGSDLSKGNIYSAETDNTSKLEMEFGKLETNQMFGGSIDTIRMTYVMDLVIAGVLILVSICLVAIAGVMMKFIIRFTVNEDFRQIGIMKAIGIRNSDIRKIYSIKYVAIAVLGGVIGFAASLPFSNILVENATKNIIVRGDGYSILSQIASSVLLIVVIILLAYFSTGKLKKMTPMDAIRSGESGERFKRKGIISLRKTRMNSTTFMAVNDVINELRKYIALFVIGIIGMWLIIMPVNTINTLSSPKISRWFAVLECDMWIGDDTIISECIFKGNDEYAENLLAETKENLEDNGVKIEKIMLEIMFNYSISKDDVTYKSVAFKGYGTRADEYYYDEGEAPKYENEIALAYGTAEKIDANIGDTVSIKMFDKEEKFIVTALYQSMNNLGQGIRFHEDKEMDYNSASGGFGIQVIFPKGTTDKQADKYFEITKEHYDGVKDMKTFLSDMIGGIAEQIEVLKTIILVVVIIINILVIVLLQKMFMITEKGQIAMLKSIGFKNRSIIGWQTKRVTLVLLLGMIIGLVTSTPFSQITSGQVFKIMGATQIEFVVNPIEVFVVYPTCVFVAAVGICILTMLSVRKVTVSDMNCIE